MLNWLESRYEVFVIEQESPGKLYEWPALKFAADLSENSMEPVLYLHTKGAGNPREQQKWVRDFWKTEFTDKISQYFDAVSTLSPTVSAPIVSKKNRICWFNGFVMNPAAAREIGKRIVIKYDRMWYEQGLLTSCTSVDCVGILADCADTPEDGWDEFIRYMFKRVGIVALAKGESRYLNEWLDYHARIGITDFFLFDNGEIGDDSQARVIDAFNRTHPKTSVHLYDIRGRAALEKIGFQAGAYNYITSELQKGRYPARWLAYIDIDEFIHLDEEFPTIQSFLWSDPFRWCDQVHLNWRCFGDNGEVKYRDIPVRERFRTSASIDCRYNDDIAHTENQYVKNIVRLSSRPRNSQAHTAYMKDGVCLDALGKSIDGNRTISDRIVHQRAWIDHYCTKSLEEYIDRRCIDLRNIANSDQVDIEKRIRWYFNLNDKTEEKIEYIRKKLGNNYAS